MKRTIMEAIELSALAYQDKEIVEETLSKKYTEVYWMDLPGTDTQGFFCMDKDNAWVVIRGTEFDNFEDWKTNFDITFIDSHWGQVHKGFRIDAIQALWDLKKFMTMARLNHKKIIFTGHSQGAAVALQMFAYRIWNQFGEKIQCIPIEAPRSFSKKAAKALGAFHGKNIYPVVHNNDIVHNVPPRCMGYSHIQGTRMNYIDRKGKVHRKISKWNKFKDSIFGYLRDFGKLGLDGLKDHDIGNIRDIWRAQL